MLKITAKSIVDELKNRNIPTEILAEQYGIVRYRHNDQWHLLRSCASPDTSWLGSFVARHKQIAHAFLSDKNLREPETCEYEDDSSALAFMERLGTIVVKPTDGGHGNGVTVGITTKTALSRAIKAAKRVSRSGRILLQEQVKGDDVRVLIVGGEYAAAAQRTPATVAGDGVRTIRELIDQENQENTDRGSNYQKRLNYIDAASAERFLGARIDTEIPEADEIVRVTGPANIGAGGTSRNLTDDIPRVIVEKAEQVAMSLGLPTCGVDFMVEDISRPESYRFIEVNACPSFGLHLFPSIGKPEPVTKKFVDYLLERPL